MLAALATLIADHLHPPLGQTLAAFLAARLRFKLVARLFNNYLQELICHLVE
jgi:hypothetical protein